MTAPVVEKRPAFDPTWLTTSEGDADGFVPVLRHPVSFSLDVFFQILASSFVLHPEHNSSNVLRADILSDSTLKPDHAKGKAKAEAPEDFKLDTLVETRRIRRKLLPKTRMDSAVLQDCIFREDPHRKRGDFECLPLFEDGLSQDEQAASLPFYHPRLKAMAFRYRPSDSSSAEPAVLEVWIKPFASTALPLDRTSRLARTLLNLLRTFHKHCVIEASATPYVKRVHHDVLVQRETYQDLYQELKRRYSWILGEWREKTDPAKHVFEDVGIASWLMCLWKDMYPPVHGGEGREAWGRPPGGFVDVGCGNGLLVYILHKEGYDGFGFDLRGRKSWALFAPLGADLREASFTPSSLLDLSGDTSLFPPASFLIGNHADELTPWVPIITSLIPGAASANIPCCLHRTVGKFGDQKHVVRRPELMAAFGLDAADEELANAAEKVVLSSGLETVIGRNELGGRYQAYVRYVAHLALSCGFIPEHESLRIPSTRNIAVVARNRCADVKRERLDLTETQRRASRESARQKAEGFVREVEGKWEVRKKEGNAH